MTITKPLPDVLIKVLALWDAFTPDDERRVRGTMGDSASFIEAMQEAGIEPNLMYRASPVTVKLGLLAEMIQHDTENFAVKRFEPAIQDIVEIARREGRTEATPEEIALLESLHQEHAELRLLSHLMILMAGIQHRMSHPVGACSPTGVVTNSGDVFQSPNQEQEYPCKFSQTLPQVVSYTITNNREALAKLTEDILQEVQGTNPMQALARKIIGLMENLTPPPKREKNEE